MINWNNIKFRASSWGNLLTEPREKAKKEAGELGATCIKELVKIYNMEVFGRKKEIITRAMSKGTQAEPQSIALFSVVEGVLYEKNEDELENEWFRGHPDTFTGLNIREADEVWDLKTRWDMDNFTPKLIEEVDKGEELQLQVYFCLTGAKKGGIANTLVSIPENLLMEEKKKLLFQMNVISEFSPEYLLAAAELEKNLVFEDVPIELRLIKQPVDRNDDLIEKMKAKVPIFRKWLQDLHTNHMNRNKKLVEM